jgi:hypothetical protein
MAEPVQQRCPRNHLHWVVKQAKVADCGPSCISIVLHRIGHRQADTSIADIRQLSAQYGGHYRPSPKDVTKGLSPQIGALAAVIRSDLGSGRDGTMSGNLTAILKHDFGLTNTIHQQAPSGKALKAIIKANVTPTILHVEWDKGAHFIVADGRESHWIGFSDYCFSDPYYGLVSHKLNDAARSEYRPAPGTVGTFSGWYIANIA